MSYPLYSDQRPGHIVGEGCKCTRQKRCSVHRLPVSEKPGAKKALAALRASARLSRKVVGIVEEAR